MAKEKSGIFSHDTWFGKRQRIDIGLFNKKELAIYRLGISCKVLAHLLWFSAYTFIAVVGYITIARASDSQFGEWGRVSAMTYNAFGHAFFGVCQSVIGWLTREKVSKTKLRNGNPVLKRSWLGVVLMIIALIPPIVYLIGRLIIWLHFRKQPVVDVLPIKPKVISGELGADVPFATQVGKSVEQGVQTLTDNLTDVVKDVF